MIFIFSSSNIAHHCSEKTVSSPLGRRSQQVYPPLSCFISLSSAVNLAVFIALIPVVIYASLRPLFCQGFARFLKTYESLPTVEVLPSPGGQWDDLSMYLLYMEENLSELKSYKYIKVCLGMLK